MGSVTATLGTGVVVTRTREQAVRESASRLLAATAAAIERRDRADVAFGFGPTAELVYAALHELPAQPDWSKVVLWQTDESFVPASHPARAATRIRTALLGDRAARLGVPAQNLRFYPVDEVIDGGGAAEACAQLYSQTLIPTLQQEHRRPHLDLLVAEVSAEGNVLSIFPESPAFEPVAGHVVCTQPPAGHDRATRMTLTAKCFDLVPEILVLGTGAERSKAVADTLLGVREPRLRPAQLLVRRSATWILDEAAAGAAVPYPRSA